MASLIPDAIKDTLGDLLTTWNDVEQLKLRKKLAETQLSLNMAGSAYITPDMAAQNARYTAMPSGTSNALIIGGIVLALGAVVILASK